MKKLDRFQMKQLRGGYVESLAELSFDGGIECKASCYKWTNGYMQSASCEKSRIVVGGLGMDICDCNLVGATSCS